MGEEGQSTDRVRPVRVLVIDDHRMFADVLEMLLAGEDGIESVGAVGSAEEALSVCERECPDVVLMDIDLPGMDGIEATLRVRAICPEAQVVAITALPPGDLISRAIEAGAIGFISKTRAADELVDVIRKAAVGEMVLPAENLSSVLARLQDSRRTLQDAKRLFDQLTERELEVLQAMTEGKSVEALAESLYLSPHTVQGHMRNILAKLGVHSKLDAVLLALKHGYTRITQS